MHLKLGNRTIKLLGFLGFCILILLLTIRSISLRPVGYFELYIKPNKYLTTFSFFNGRVTIDAPGIGSVDYGTFTNESGYWIWNISSNHFRRLEPFITGMNVIDPENQQVVWMGRSLNVLDRLKAKWPFAEDF